MSDEAKEPRPARNWASGIPLVTLLAVVFGAGALYMKLDALADQIKDVVPRVQALEIWRAVHEAAGARRRR